MTRVRSRIIQRKWTVDEAATAASIYAEMIGQGDYGTITRIDRAIAAVLGRPVYGVSSRRLDHGTSFGSGVLSADVAAPRAVHFRDPPPCVLAEREARLVARDGESLTGAFCGDPPPGFSALDRRGP